MAITGIEIIASPAVSYTTSPVGIDAVNDPSLAAEFEGLMNDPDMIVTPANGADFYQVESGITNPFHIDTSPTIGENLLEIMQDVRTNIDGNFSSLQTAVTEVDANSITDLIGLQYDVVRFSFELDMTTKIAGQMSSHADRFLNQQ
mgnify:CR=1 FL=1